MNETHDGPLMDLTAGKSASGTSRAVTNSIIACFKDTNYILKDGNASELSALADGSIVEEQNHPTCRVPEWIVAVDKAMPYHVLTLFIVHSS